MWEQTDGDEDTVEVMTEAEAREREHYRLERKYMAQVSPTICLSPASLRARLSYALKAAVSARGRGWSSCMWRRCQLASTPTSTPASILPLHLPLYLLLNEGVCDVGLKRQ